MQTPVRKLKEKATEVQMGEKCGRRDSRQEYLRTENRFKEESVFVPQGGAEKMTNALM